MSLPKILLAAPTSDKKDYCFDKWADMVQSLDYPRYSVLLVDNSHNEEYYHKILDKGIYCIHVKPEGNVVDYITDCQNLIRYHTLKGGFDYLFSLETDVFPTPDILYHLVHHDKPVVTAPYFVQYKGGDPTICWLDAEPQFFGRQSYLSTRLLTTQETLHRIEGKLVKVFACGIGCTLIHSSVLQEVHFRSDVQEHEVRTDKSVFSDSLFYVDCLSKGIGCYLDTRIMADHQYSGWDTNLDLYKN